MLGAVVSTAAFDPWTRWSLVATAIGTLAIPIVAWIQLSWFNRNERRKAAVEYIERFATTEIPIAGHRYTVQDAVRLVKEANNDPATFAACKQVWQSVPRLARTPLQEQLVDQYVRQSNGARISWAYFTKTEGLMAAKAIDARTFLLFMSTIAIQSYRDYSVLDRTEKFGMSTTAFHDLKMRAWNFQHNSKFALWRRLRRQGRDQYPLWWRFFRRCFRRFLRTAWRWLLGN